jgi:hypothetical protein
MRFAAIRKSEPIPLTDSVTTCLVQIVGNHLPHHGRKGDLGTPSKLLPGFGRVPEKAIDFRWTEIARIDVNERFESVEEIEEWFISSSEAASEMRRPGGLGLCGEAPCRAGYYP